MFLSDLRVINYHGLRTPGKLSWETFVESLHAILMDTLQSVVTDISECNNIDLTGLQVFINGEQVEPSVGRYGEPNNVDTLYLHEPEFIYVLSRQRMFLIVCNYLKRMVTDALDHAFVRTQNMGQSLTNYKISFELIYPEADILILRTEVYK